MNTLKLGILGSLASLFLLGSVGVAWASSSSQAEQRGVFGVVSEIAQAPDGTRLNLDTRDGLVTIAATSETTVRVPGRESASVGDVAIGDSVAVLALGGDARSILIKPDRPVRSSHFVGVVTRVEEDGTVSIVDDRGNQISAAAVGGVSGLRPGELVTAILNRDLDTDALSITGLEGAIENLDRIQAALDGAQQSTVRATLETLKTRLANNSARHLTILQEVAQRVSSTVESVILEELGEAVEAYAPVLARFDAGNPSAEVSGVIGVIDSERRQLTIERPDLEPVDLPIVMDTSIQVLGRDIGFGALSVGDRVVARYDIEAQAASRILVLPGGRLDQRQADVLLPMVRQCEISGDISVDLLASPPTVTISPTAPEGGQLLTLTVSEGSVILANGEPVELVSTLLVGPMAASFDPESLALIELDTLSVDASREKTVAGVVHSFVSKTTLSGNFSILAADGQVLTFNHKEFPETVIRRDGRQVSISEVRLGDLVRPNTRYLTDSKDLVLLSLKSPGAAKVRGVIRGVTTTAEGQKRITISSERLEVITLLVTFDTELAVGQRVLNADYDPISLEATRLDLGPLSSLRGNRPE